MVTLLIALNERGKDIVLLISISLLSRRQFYQFVSGGIRPMLHKRSLNLKLKGYLGTRMFLFEHCQRIIQRSDMVTTIVGKRVQLTVLERSVPKWLLRIIFCIFTQQSQPGTFLREFRHMLCIQNVRYRQELDEFLRVRFLANELLDCIRLALSQFRQEALPELGEFLFGTGEV